MTDSKVVAHIPYLAVEDLVLQLLNVISYVLAANVNGEVDYVVVAGREDSTHAIFSWIPRHVILTNKLACSVLYGREKKH